MYSMTVQKGGTCDAIKARQGLDFDVVLLAEEAGDDESNNLAFG